MHLGRQGVEPGARACRRPRAGAPACRRRRTPTGRRCTAGTRRPRPPARRRRRCSPPGCSPSMPSAERNSLRLGWLRTSCSASMPASTSDCTRLWSRVRSKHPAAAEPVHARVAGMGPVRAVRHKVDHQADHGAVHVLARACRVRAARSAPRWSGAAARRARCRRAWARAQKRLTSSCTASCEAMSPPPWPPAPSASTQHSWSSECQWPQASSLYLRPPLSDSSATSSASMPCHLGAGFIVQAVQLGLVGVQEGLAEEFVEVVLRLGWRSG